jgi:hypothetical protein
MQQTQLGPDRRPTLRGEPVLTREHQEDPTMCAGRREYFHCTRCCYKRSLQVGEDGFQLYLHHALFCNAAAEHQLWLPFIEAGDASNVPS